MLGRNGHKREFVLKRAGKDVPEIFTTRWAMSYLRGPLTRDQIKQLVGDDGPATPGAITPGPATAESAAAAAPATRADAPAPGGLSQGGARQAM